MHAALTLDAAWLTTVLLVSLRIAATLVATPVLAAGGVPLPVRILLVLALAAVVVIGLPADVLPASTGRADGRGLGALLQAGLTELSLGAALGLGILLAFAAFSLAGSLIGIQIGFGLGQVFDPATSTSAPFLTSAFNQLAVVVFFVANGHHALIRGLAYSFERFPVGRPWPIEAAVAPVLWQVTGLFSLGFALAAPVVWVLLMVELALGVVARNLPQMNMLAVGIPAKVVAGLLALALWLGGMGDVMARVYATIQRSWSAIFATVAASGDDAALAASLARAAGLPRSGGPADG